MKLKQNRRSLVPRIDETRATKILSPLASFFISSGLSASAAQRSFSQAIQRASRLDRPRTMEEIGPGEAYADVVNRWRRDERFLNSTGSPKDLSMLGRNGFAALVRVVGAGLTAKETLDVLIRYGSVKKLSEGKYRLVRPFFSITSSRAIAYEPMASFLCDVMLTFDRISRRRADSRDPKLFWRKVDRVGVPTRLIDEFMALIGERSLTFLEGIDDWLEAHALPGGPNEPRRRVGLGLFSIYSDPERRDSGRRGSFAR